MENNAFYQEQKIKAILSEMGSIFYNIQIRYEFEERNYDNPELDQLENIFFDLANRVYTLISAYIEKKRLPKFYDNFVEEAKYFFETKQNLYDSEYHEESGDNYSLFISTIWKYLSAFPAFGSMEEELLKRTGLLYLENILKNTAIILKDKKIIPKTETDIVPPKVWTVNFKS